MKEKKIKQGYEWKETSAGGYWVKTTGFRHSHRLPLFCPHCNKFTGEVDAKWLEEFGICWECHTMYVDSREKSLIDLAKYKK